MFLSHSSLNLAKEFGGKTSEHDLAERTKDKFKLVKTLRRYSITSIIDPAMKISIQILTSKVMQKCHSYEVLALVLSLATQCTEGVQFNWSCYLSSEFLTNCCEGQDERKTFHYAWLFLSIMLLAWELLEDSQFPPLEKGLSKATQFASLWATNDVARVTETKILWVLMEATIHMDINQKPWLSPTMFE